MKVFKNRAVAVAVLIAAVVISSLVGWSKRPAVEVPKGGAALDESLSTGAFVRYVVDTANVLSDRTEQAICLYNANWDQRIGGILAVVTVPDGGADLEETAWTWLEDSLEMGANDALLLLETETADLCLVANDGVIYRILSDQPASFVDGCLADYLEKRDYNGGIQNLCGQMHVLFSTQPSGGTVLLWSGAVLAVVLLLVLVLVITLLDSRRFRPRRYGSRPVVIAPRPYVPRPPRPPMGGMPPPPPRRSAPPPRPPASRPSAPRSGGTPRRGGSFGGGSRGGGSRGGSFGGGRRR